MTTQFVPVYVGGGKAFPSCAFPTREEANATSRKVAAEHGIGLPAYLVRVTMKADPVEMRG